MDDVDFLRTHACEVDTEVTVDSALRRLNRFPQPDAYELDLFSGVFNNTAADGGLHNVVDVRLKMCHVPAPPKHFLHERSRTLYVRVHQTDGADGAQEHQHDDLGVRAVVFGDDVNGGNFEQQGLQGLLRAIRDADPSVQLLLSPTSSFKVTNSSDSGVVLRFAGRGLNHPRLCRALGLDPYAHDETVLHPGQEAPYVSSWAAAAYTLEYANVLLNGWGRFVVPMDRGDGSTPGAAPYVPRQNTRYIPRHPQGVLKSVGVRLLDRDGEPLGETVEGHWFVLQVRHLSMRDAQLTPEDFRGPRLAAQGYVTTGGLYGQRAYNEDLDDDDNDDDDEYDNVT